MWTIFCTPFLYPSSPVEHSLGVHCYWSLRSWLLQKSWHTELKPIGPGLWCGQSGYQTHWITLPLLNKTSAISFSSVALLKPSYELARLPLMTWSRDCSSDLEERIILPHQLLTVCGPVSILPYLQSNFLEHGMICFLHYLKETVSLQEFSLPHLNPLDAHTAALQ